MKINIIVNGQLQILPKGLPINETVRKNHPKFVERYLKRLLSIVYKQFENCQDFTEFMPKVLEETCQYFTYENITVEELAGYFQDETDVDFNNKLDDETAYRLAEWAIEIFYRMEAGDFEIFNQFEEEIPLLSIWEEDLVEIKREKKEEFQQVEHQHCHCHHEDQVEYSQQEEEEQEEEQEYYDEDFCNYDDGLHEL